MKGLQSGNILVLAWRDKRYVFHITDFHDMGTESKRRVQKGGGVQEVMRPKMNALYSAKMKGTDVQNQRESYYHVYRRTVRYYVRILQHLLEVSVLNGHIASGETLEMLPWRRRLIQQLAPIDPNAEQNRAFTGADLHLPEKAEAPKRCSHCQKRRSKTCCSNCRNMKGNKVALCVTPCFKEFHFRLVRGAITTKQEAQAVVANDDSSLDRVAAAMLILNDENAEEKAPRVVKKNKFKLSPRKRKRRSAPDDNSRPNKRRGNKPGDNNGDNDPADMIDE